MRTLRNNKIDEVGKALMKCITMQVHLQKKVYKYLTYESGRLMLEYSNIQFTRASKLNDSIDCHIDKIDYSEIYKSAQGLIDVDIINKKKEQEKEFLNSIGICSLGKTSDNETLWKRYTRVDDKESGICIELDVKKIINYFIQDGKPKYGFIALPVNYVPKVESSIDRGYLSAGGNYNLLFGSKLLATKYAPKWEDEQEMRFVLVEGIGDNDYFRETIPTTCITKVTLGKYVNHDQVETIKQIVCNKYNNIPVEYRK